MARGPPVHCRVASQAASTRWEFLNDPISKYSHLQLIKKMEKFFLASVFFSPFSFKKEKKKKDECRSLQLCSQKRLAGSLGDPYLLPEATSVSSKVNKGTVTAG